MTSGHTLQPVPVFTRLNTRMNHHIFVILQGNHLKSSGSLSSLVIPWSSLKKTNVAPYLSNKIHPDPIVEAFYMVYLPSQHPL